MRLRSVQQVSVDLRMSEHAMRRYRKEKGLPLDALAKVAGVSRGTISKIETGRQLPSVGLIRRLIAVTGGALCADDFIGNTE
jgi:DNA-binding XRE family transcriptional regulator